MLSFGFLSSILLLGVLLRKKVTLFQQLYLPASIISGLIALIIIQVLEDYHPALTRNLTLGWMDLPGLLINIVFASLFLGKKLPSIKEIWTNCSRQLAYGQIVAWGQYTVGCLVVLCLLGPWMNIPDVFAGVMPVGFEGGHGTAGGMGRTFDKLGFPEIKDYALATATCGIIGAIILGMFLVNWAVRVGHVKKYNRFASTKDLSAGRITISSDIIGALAFHIGFIGLAVLLGWIIKAGLLKVAALFSEQLTFLFDAFPLFPLCMIGGAFIQACIDKYRFNKIICPNLMLRIQNASLDFLIITAIAMIKLDIILAGWIPLVTVVFTGFIWNLFCVLYLAPRTFKDAWFERSIAEMGQSMGVTATGLLLLRTVDPDYETAAASAFASKQLLHEPFMGGGLWTGLAIPLLVLWGGWIVFGITIIVILFWSGFLYFTKS